MEGTKVYGASDDLIEFEGEFNGEIGAYGIEKEEPALVMLSDGTVLSVYYGKPDSAIWGIDVMHKGSLFDRIEICTSEDADIYSDVVYLKPGIKWAYFAKAFEVVK